MEQKFGKNSIDIKVLREFCEREGEFVTDYPNCLDGRPSQTMIKAMMHYRQLQLHHERLALWIIIISFVLLQMCWWGINYLPSAQGSSVHTYSISE